MYSPPPECKKNSIAREAVCENVSGLQWRMAPSAFAIDSKEVFSKDRGPAHLGFSAIACFARVHFRLARNRLGTARSLGSRIFALKASGEFQRLFTLRDCDANVYSSIRPESGRKL